MQLKYLHIVQTLFQPETLKNTNFLPFIALRHLKSWDGNKQKEKTET